MKQYQKMSASRIQINSNGNCFISMDTMMNNDMKLSLPNTLKSLTYGDFVYDKTLGFWSTMSLDF